jgi:hypothetical protein
VPKKYLLLGVENRNIILWFKCVLTALHVNCIILFDKVLLLEQYFLKYIINNWGLMKKKTILDEVVFILFLCYITVTCRHTIVFTANIASQTSKRHLSACNI